MDCGSDDELLDCTLRDERIDEPHGENPDRCRRSRRTREEPEVIGLAVVGNDLTEELIDATGRTFAVSMTLPAVRKWVPVSYFEICR